MAGLRIGQDNAGPDTGTDLFFYGSLCHFPLLEIVLGRQLSGNDISETSLPDHAVYWVKGQGFPIIVASPGQMALGVRVANLSEQDLARLDFYEGGFAYETRVMTLSDGGKAKVFFSDNPDHMPGEPWVLADWVDYYGGIAERAAKEIMSYEGRFSAAEVAQRFNVIQMRAWTQILAAETPKQGKGSGMGRDDFDVIKADRPYSTFFAMDDLSLKFRRFSGEMSDEIQRYVFVGTDAVIVLPYDPVRDRVLLVEQVRIGTFVRGAPENWTLEPVAGLIDPAESPEQAARRESLEETGLALKELHAAAGYYPSPGATSEYYHNFVGIADIADESTGLAGLEEENEDIRTHILDFHDLMDFVDQNAAQVGPLYVLALWLARHRDRLRASA